MKRLFYGLVLIAAASLACDSTPTPRSTATDAPVATLTATAEAVPNPSIPSATVRATPQPGALMVQPLPTAVPREVQTVIDAVAARDVEGLLRAVRYVERPCTAVPPQGAGGPPICKPGDSDGTPYRVFLSLGCEGHWEDDARPLLESLVKAGSLFAVAVLYSDDTWTDNHELYGEYQLVFHPAPGAPVINAAYVVMGGGKILRTQLACATTERGIRYRGTGPQMPLLVGPLAPQ